MSAAEVKRFLAQFDQARKDMATWPKWMRDAAYVATASFPKPPPKRTEP